MIWQDLLFDRVVDDNALRHAFAEAFAIAPNAVRIVDAITPKTAQTDRGIRILIERFVMPGEFPLQVSVYLLDDCLAQPDERQHDAVRIVSRVCARLQSSCLMSDESLSVVSWWRVYGSGLVEAVALDETALERDEYNVVSGVPVTGRSRNHPAR